MGMPRQRHLRGRYARQPSRSALCRLLVFILLIPDRVDLLLLALPLRLLLCKARFRVWQDPPFPDALNKLVHPHHLPFGRQEAPLRLEDLRVHGRFDVVMPREVVRIVRILLTLGVRHGASRHPANDFHISFAEDDVAAIVCVVDRSRLDGRVVRPLDGRVQGILAIVGPPRDLAAAHIVPNVIKLVIPMEGYPTDGVSGVIVLVIAAQVIRVDVAPLLQLAA
mmetsp:Transcript_15256/g.57992  ORF Transcript_15256/g.57992 Transcript_15256/m.57992 type:complete len:223 (+) Transcript_15256:1685-2353(+)